MGKVLKVLLPLLIMPVIILSKVEASFADGDEGFIYGKITMRKGNSYQGVIRWGKEETFWDDMFNASKLNYALEDQLTSDELDYLEDEVWSGRRRDRRSFWRGGGRGDWTAQHQFKCRFGDLKRIEMRRGDDVVLVLKNNEEIEVSGGSNDIGAKIRVLDEEVGEVSLNWKRIESVEFMSTPRKVERKFGSPLYGTVETRHGSFEGFIQWDHEECVSTDILDGDHEDGKMAIEFGKIRSIERESFGSLVTLWSGRELELDGSNDVNKSNRGIIVRDAMRGKIWIKWKAFHKVTFKDNVEDSGPAYSDFLPPKQLTGVIETDDDESLSGRLIYDLDETLDMEILDGQDDGITYLIPFRNIKSITPKGRHGAVVQLKNGEEIRLEDSRDIDRDNDGLLIWDSGSELSYVAWQNIRKVDFK